MADTPDSPNTPDFSADESANISGDAPPQAPGTPSPNPPGGQPEPQFDHIGVLGHAGWLMSRSEEHRGTFITDLEWRVMPAVALGQFRLWREGHMPVAFATWAYVDDRVAARLETGNKRLAPGEWKCGTNPVIVDLIAPFGGDDQAREELKGVMG